MEFRHKISRFVRSIAMCFVLKVVAMLRSTVKVCAANYWSRKWLNAVYRRLTFSQRRIFHRLFAKIFQGEDRRVDPGSWIVEFVGRQITLPLKAKSFWLDWDTAVSIVGHDVEIKTTYASLISSPQPPELFVDIGANYGTHSLLFLMHRIDAIAFEPNASCHEYFREICALNSVDPRIEGVALGDKNGDVELYYPEKYTWLGTTDVDVKQKLEVEHRLHVQTVKLKTVDDYLVEFGNRRLVIKIDTEGNEYKVLQGALHTLQQNRPLVIFENRRGENRKELFELFISQGYRITSLPWIQDKVKQFLNLHQFLQSPSNNFIAVPTTMFVNM